MLELLCFTFTTVLSKGGKCPGSTFPRDFVSAHDDEAEAPVDSAQDYFSRHQEHDFILQAIVNGKKCRVPSTADTWCGAAYLGLPGQPQ